MIASMTSTVGSTNRSPVDSRRRRTKRACTGFAATACDCITSGCSALLQQVVDIRCGLIHGWLNCALTGDNALDSGDQRLGDVGPLRNWRRQSGVLEILGERRQYWGLETRVLQGGIACGNTVLAFAMSA